MLSRRKIEHMPTEKQCVSEVKDFKNPTTLTSRPRCLIVNGKTGPSLGLILGRHSAPFPTPNSIFFSQIYSSKFPTEHSQICWPKLVQSNNIYSSNSVLLSFINVQMALVNAVIKGYYHWSVLWMRVVYLHKTALPLKRHSNVDYYWLRNRK